MSKPIIICVDDEMMVLSTLVEELQYIIGKNFEFEIAQSGDEVLDLMDELIAEGLAIPLVFTDCCMPGIGGIELIPKIKALSPQTLCVLLTGMEQCDLGLTDEMNAHILGYVPKPWTESHLRAIIRDAQLFSENSLVSVPKLP